MISPSDCYLQHNCKKHKQNECPVDDASCLRLSKQDILFDYSLLTQKQRRRKDLRLDITQQDREAFIQLQQIEQEIQSFVAEGKCLYLCSSITGNGKTEWALRLVQAYVHSIWPESDLTCKALFINVPRYLLELKANISRPSEYIETVEANLLSAELVVFDDIGSKLGTAYEIENLLASINNRIDNDKCNIYTSNILPEDVSEQLGPRLASRIVGMSTIIELKEQDKRGLIR